MIHCATYQLLLLLLLLLRYILHFAASYYMHIKKESTYLLWWGHAGVHTCVEHACINRNLPPAMQCNKLLMSHMHSQQACSSVTTTCLLHAM